MVQTVKEFVTDSYQLISAGTPTTPLKGNDMSKGVQLLNELLSSYSGTGLMLTIAQEISTPVLTGQMFVEFAASGADVNVGRLANLADAWLVLTGVTYPLIPVSINTFNEQYKYAPLRGLPIYAIIDDQVDRTRLQLYPAPSQAYELFVYGKFELGILLESGNMASLPLYFTRFLKIALAKELAFYKGRASAWDDKLEKILVKAEDDMSSVSEINLNICEPIGNQLNGAYRVRAGI
jgi:hypothetical protein